MTAAATLALGALIDRAIEGARSKTTFDFGPLPLRLAAESQRGWRAIADQLAAGTAPDWAALDIISVSSATIDRDDFPHELVPSGNGVRVARVGAATVISSGPERSVWILDRERATAVRWAAESGPLAAWERASPLRSPASWWAIECGAAFVHTAAVASAAGAVLLVGQSGAGKSTTAMACLDRGLTVVGDDFCFVEPPSRGRPSIVHAAYRFAKLDDTALDLLPHLRTRATGLGPRGKTMIELDHVGGAYPIVAVCSVAHDPSAPTGVVPASRIETLRAVAPSTLLQTRPLDDRVWKTLTTLVEHTPGFRLNVNELDSVPTLIDDLIDSCVGATAALPA